MPILSKYPKLSIFSHIPKAFSFVILLIIACLFIFSCSSSGIKVTPINSNKVSVQLSEGSNFEFNTIGLKSCGGSISRNESTKSLTRQIFVGFSGTKIRQINNYNKKDVALVTADALLDNKPVAALVFTAFTGDDCLLDQVFWVMNKNSLIFTEEVVNSLTSYLRQLEIWSNHFDKAGL